MSLHATDAETESADFTAWRLLVDKALNGRAFSALQTRTRDGIVIDPLYPPPSEPAPGQARLPGPWRIVQVLEASDPDVANRQACEDVAAGATGLALRFAPPGNGASGLPPTSEALHAVLAGVEIVSLHIRVEPTPAAGQIAPWLVDLIAGRGIAPERADVAFGLDILAGAAAGAGELKSAAALCARLRRAGFSGPFVELDSRPIHGAGGTEAQELAVILASAVCWLRALEREGLDPAAALPCLGASASADRDQWLTIAKLRALRLLWARLLEICGVAHLPLPIHAETGRRMMTRADPHTNIIRATIAAFASAIGGADSIAVTPFDTALESRIDQARALARNTHHLLLQESQLHRVCDPAAGSGAVEALTAALASAAWGEFQAIEREGGILESLRSGALQSRVATARQALATEMASGKAPLVGSTVYRQAGVEPPPQPVAAVPTAAALAPIRLEDLARGLA